MDHVRTYLLNTESPFNFILFGATLLSSILFISIYWQVYDDNMKKSRYYLEQICNNNNLFKQFLQEKSDSFDIKIFTDISIEFKNYCFNKMKILMDNYTINGQELLNSQKISLSTIVKNLIKSFEVQNSKKLVDRKSVV